MEHKLRRHRLVCARQAPWSSNVASALGRSVDSAAGEIRAQFVDAGWGKDVPEMLRNDNWNYAVFTADKQHRPGVNQAECLACHKPLNNDSYTFTLKQLAEAK